MSDLLDAAYEMNKDLFNSGGIDEKTMRQIDIIYVANKNDFTPESIKRIREENNISQDIFASLLGTKKTTVEHWEQGLKKPNDMAKRLLDLIDRKGIAALA